LCDEVGRVPLVSALAASGLFLLEFSFFPSLFFFLLLAFFHEDEEIVGVASATLAALSLLLLDQHPCDGPMCPAREQ
jgi:hypothetical protein